MTGLPRDPLTLRLCLALVRVCALLVPRPSRAAWRAEWESEFRHRHTALRESHRLDWGANADLVRRALGALPDAAWLRRQVTMDADVVHDMRHGVRMLRRAPSFTAAAVAILTLGIGGTVAVATLLDTLYFRPLPYADADRIVTVWQRAPSGAREDVAPANFLDWRERSRSFSHLAAVVPQSYDYSGAGEPEVFFGAQVTEGFLEVMGIRPLIGRDFAPGDHVRGAARVALITHGLWQRRFGGDPAIVDRPLELDGMPFTVVGVLPPEFRPQLLPRPGEVSVWTPKVILDHERRTRGSAWWNVVGRLRPGVTEQEAQNEMAAIAATLAREYPRTNERVGAVVVSLRDHLMGDVRLPLLVLLGAVVLVLVIACANVASLLLARGLAREREFAVRAALGAGRARLVRQLMVESLVLSGISAAAGLLLAHWLISAIVTVAPGDVVRLHDAVLDTRILVFTAVLTAATALAFGVLPALQFSRPDRDVIRERQPSAPRAAVRRLLVAGEVALAVVLLTGAGLLIRSLDRLLAVDPGFSPANTVALQVFAHDRNPTDDQVRAFFNATLERLAQLPGVEAAGAVSAMPFTQANIDIKSTLDVVGRPSSPADEQRPVYVTVATPGFFHALSVPVREGRLLAAGDTARSPTVAVISEALRRREWPDESPIGRRIQVHWHGRRVEAEVVGVVNQLRHDALDAAARPEVFFALEQLPFASMTYVLRGSVPADDLIAAARKAVWSVDPKQTFYQTGAVQRMVESSVARQRFSTTVVAVVAAVAMLLSAVGLYGVISFATAQRTREIGVRMALGADRRAIRRMVLREGGLLAAAGIVVGLGGSLAVGQYLQSLLFEIHPADPVTLISVPVLLGFVALAACYVPAVRATKVDPLVALRNE
ncbi:MAG TPA: ABC transporter permease [Vicinamibacterales bacterium]|nr:ABC transporter permease [Vicinamibacterales bacterium]